ncbi:MAG: aminoacyl--tRNA ligase-related protein [Nitrososphaerota archaeon]|nr:aminoacyl--tRNA ligase-related protein [Nitrososphaerota archaeon]
METTYLNYAPMALGVLEGKKGGIKDIKLKVSVELNLSRDLSGGEVEKVVDYALSIFPRIFSKGAASSEAPRIEELMVKGNVISMTVTSGRRVRAHEAIKRARKALSEDLGPRMELGVRSINVKSFEISFIGDNLKEVKLPLVKRTEIIEGGLKYWLELQEADLYNQVPDRIISLFIEKQEAIGEAREVHRLVWKSPEKPVKYSRDPGSVMEEEGWVKRFHPGIWYYLQPYTSLLRIFETLIIENVLKPLGFQEIVLPKLIPLEVMKKKGQLTGIPHEMLYVSEPGLREFGFFEEYVDSVKVFNKTMPEILRKLLKEPSFCLPYAQCEPFYELFSGEVVNLDNPPVKLYDRSGFSFRHEAGGLRSLERLMAFTRIEIVYLGRPEEVSEIRDKLIDNYVNLLDKILDLEVRTAEVTPVWMAHAGVVSDVERKIPATLDVEAYLPFRGDRESSEWLEIANASVHYDKYVEWYNIKERKNREVWTGCSGNGLERWIYAFLSRHGFNSEDWPLEVRKLWTSPGSPLMDTWPPRVLKRPLG